MFTPTNTSIVVNPREERGIAIAKASQIRRKGDAWVVPSQSKEDPYTVQFDGGAPRCTCPDHTIRSVKCKHIFAVEFTITEQTAPDGTVTITKTKRATYRQEWTAYNAAQTHEAERFVELLAALCQGVAQPEQRKGRPRLPLADMVFCAVFKTYSTFSGRRSMSDLRDCAARGYISRAPHYNSVFNYLEDATLTPILKMLVEESATPLKAVESDFAVDSTGFTTHDYIRWYDAKYGKERAEHGYLKAHAMVGVNTNIITAIEVTPSTSHDSPLLPPLLTTTVRRFAPVEISADKGYLSHANVKAINEAGATPYIPFKTHNTGKGPELWRRMYHLFAFERDTFLAHYHKRSNVETTFSMIKAKFGGSVRSKTETARANEVLTKCLAHNLCCLVSAIYELGIEPTFWAESPVAQKVTA